ncbi:MAG: methyltransferase domain-containing protein [Gemmatimonadales bacterium]
MIGTELLDDPQADPFAVRAQLGDIARLNALFGGSRVVVEALEPFFQAAGTDQHWTLLDVGTGAGDIPVAVAAAARRYGITCTTIGVERIPTAARMARSAGLRAVVGDGDALPFAPKSVDVVVASQVLHHLSREAAIRWIAGIDRLARRAVVLADLRRSRLAMAGIWLVAPSLGMSRATRHDAVVSLRRGFRRRELAALLEAAGVRATIRYRPWSRIVSAWRPHAHG